MKGFETSPARTEILARCRGIFAGCRTTACDGRTPVFAPDAKG